MVVALVMSVVIIIIRNSTLATWGHDDDQGRVQDHEHDRDRGDDSAFSSSPGAWA